MANNFKDIRAYRVSWILWFTDLFTVFPLLQIWSWRTTKGIRLDYLGDRKRIENDIKHGAFFMTNHRDIIMDAAWLSYLLSIRYHIRPYMGVGNNLFAKKWIEVVMRYLRCFVVKRNGGAHAQLENAKHLSAYIRSLRARGKSIWLAQREGRAKDSNDLTQASVLHMLTMDEGMNGLKDEGMNGLKDERSLFENVKALNICPVSITYEFDPCDYLKAAEMQLKRDDPKWRKSKKDDVLSMHTGIRGKKGRVVYRLTPSINPEIDAMLAAHPELKNANTHEQLQSVCDIIDRHIHQGYEIYERGTDFDAYIEGQLKKINIPNKDEQFLRERLIEMYSNPVKNHQIAVES